MVKIRAAVVHFRQCLLVWSQSLVPLISVAICHHTLVGRCSATLYVHMGGEVEAGRKAVGFSFFKLIHRIRTLTFRTK